MNKATIRIIISYSLFLWLLTIVQFSLPEFVQILGIKPDLLFVFCILVGYLYGISDAIIIGLIAGFIRDSLAGRFLGIGMLIFLFCSVFASIFLKKFLSRNVLIALCQVLMATILYYISINAISLIFFQSSESFFQYSIWVIQNQMIPGIVTNIITAGILFYLLKKFGPYKKASLEVLDDSYSLG